MTIKLYPPPLPIRGDAAAMPFDEQARVRAAAGHARRIYPGPLGELVFRELRAYAEFGYRLGEDGLIPRLATVVLATRSDHPTEEPPRSVIDDGNRAGRPGDEF